MASSNAYFGFHVTIFIFIFLFFFVAAALKIDLILIQFLNCKNLFRDKNQSQKQIAKRFGLIKFIDRKT
jgi:hypothetical protein